MNSIQSRRLRKEFDRLMRQTKGGIHSPELETLAKQLGRTKAKRSGGHQGWNSSFSDITPVTIPGHPSKPLNRYTAEGILKQLEKDLERFEAIADEEDGTDDNDENQ